MHVDSGVPPGVWCHVLGKADDVGLTYYFLREQLHLLLSLVSKS